MDAGRLEIGDLERSIKVNRGAAEQFFQAGSQTSQNFPGAS